jgi:hypothetical protein
MARNKTLNRCAMSADYYASSPPIKIKMECTMESEWSSCFYFVPLSKKSANICKHAKDHGYVCSCVEARKDAARKLIQALLQRVIDK